MNQTPLQALWIMLLLAALLGAGCGADDDADDDVGDDDTAGDDDIADDDTDDDDTTDDDTADDDDAAVLFTQDFDDSPLGTYTTEQLDEDWWEPPWDNGVSEGRVEVIDGAEAYAGRSLRIHYPEGSVGPSEGGAQWRLELGASYDELYLAYRLKFGDGFDFVRGGKIPGLIGGEANTGGDAPDGTDGWSARMMWRPDGEVVQYVYHPDQAETWGDDFGWDVGGARYFTPGSWHSVEHRVVMNTPGDHDGLIEGWFDGELALTAEGLRFRDVGTFAIDALYISTFFGGSDETWAATTDELLVVDDVVISTEPIWH